MSMSADNVIAMVSVKVRDGSVWWLVAEVGFSGAGMLDSPHVSREATRDAIKYLKWAFDAAPRFASREEALHYAGSLDDHYVEYGISSWDIQLDVDTFDWHLFRPSKVAWTTPYCDVCFRFSGVEQCSKCRGHACPLHFQKHRGHG